MTELWDIAITDIDGKTRRFTEVEMKIVLSDGRWSIDFVGKDAMGSISSIEAHQYALDDWRERWYRDPATAWWEQ